MSDRSRKIIAVFMMLSGIALMMVCGLRSVSDSHRAYPASGRNAEMPVIKLPNGTVSVNDADEEELTSLYGIGETLAGMINEERRLNGNYHYPEDLTAVKGIGIKKLNGFRDSIKLD